MAGSGSSHPWDEDNLVGRAGGHLSDSIQVTGR